MVAALKAGIFDDIEYVGKGEWTTAERLAEFRQYDYDNTQRFLLTLAGIGLLDRGQTWAKMGKHLPFSSLL